MTEQIRWGIIGPGNIARKFADGLKAVPDAALVAIGSRDETRARTFAAQYGAAHAFGSYAELAEAPDIDAVYIATPHPHHAAPAMACLESGKAVLCEKPFTVNAPELEAVIARARARNVFLMEAMWTRFLPVMADVRAWIDSGRIGEPRLVQADFGFRCGWNPAGRLLNPNLAGGSLLDVGVYTISFASWVFGGRMPVQVSGAAHIGATGVDEQMAAVLRYDKGELAALISAVQTATPHVATILGTAGRIQVGPPFWRATTASLTAGSDTETIERPHAANGYEYEAMEVGRCLRAGLSESPGMHLDESLQIMRIMDLLRGQWGLKYSFE